MRSEAFTLRTESLHLRSEGFTLRTEGLDLRSEGFTVRTEVFAARGRICTSAGAVTSAQQGFHEVAQRFIAGVAAKCETQSVKRTIEKERIQGRSLQPSASRTYMCLLLVLPAVNCWAIIIRPLRRTNKKTFCAKLTQGVALGYYISRPWRGRLKF